MDNQKRIRFVAKIDDLLTLNGEAPSSCTIDQLGEIVSLLYSERCKPSNPFILKAKKVVRLLQDSSVLLYYHLKPFVYGGKNIHKDFRSSLKMPFAVEPEQPNTADQSEKLSVLDAEASLSKLRPYSEFYPWLPKEAPRDKLTSDGPPTIPKAVTINRLMECLLIPPSHSDEIHVYLQNVFLFAFHATMAPLDLMAKLTDCFTFIPSLPTPERRLYPSPLYPTTMEDGQRLTHMAKVRYPTMEAVALLVIRWLASYPEDFLGDGRKEMAAMAETIAEDCRRIGLGDTAERLLQNLNAIVGAQSGGEAELDAIPVMKMFGSVFDVPTDVLARSRLILNRRGVLRIKETAGESQAGGRLEAGGVAVGEMEESEFMGVSRLSDGLVTPETLCYWNRYIFKMAGMRQYRPRSFRTMDTAELALHFSYFIHDAFMKISPREFLNITAPTRCLNITELLRRSRVLTKIVKARVTNAPESVETLADIAYKLFMMHNDEAALAVVRGLSHLASSSTSFSTMLSIADVGGDMLRTVMDNVAPLLDFRTNFQNYNMRFFASHIKTPCFCVPAIEHAMINIQQCQIAKPSIVYGAGPEPVPLVCYDKMRRLYNITYNFLRFQLDNPFDYSTISLDVIAEIGRQ